MHSEVGLVSRKADALISLTGEPTPKAKYNTWASENSTVRELLK